MRPGIGLATLTSLQVIFVLCLLASQLLTALQILAGIGNAGCTFAIELFLGWNVAYVATHNMNMRVVLRRRKIAQFYVFKGSFILDLISTIVFIAQVYCLAVFSLLPLYTSCWNLEHAYQLCTRAT